MVIELSGFYTGGIKHPWDETSGRKIGLSPLIFHSTLVRKRGLDLKTFCEHKRGEEANPLPPQSAIWRRRRVMGHTSGLIASFLCSNNREPSFKKICSNVPWNPAEDFRDRKFNIDSDWKEKQRLPPKHWKEAMQKVVVGYFSTTFQKEKRFTDQTFFFHHSVIKWSKTYMGI